MLTLPNILIALAAINLWTMVAFWRDKQAALEGDVEWGKVEAGQSAGLVDDIVPAAELLRRLVAEAEEARKRLASL